MEIKPQLTTHDWLNLPSSTRLRLVEVFNIKKSKGVILEGNVVKSDGYTYEDLQAISIDKLQYWVESDSTDFYELFNLALARIQEEAELQIAEENAPDPKQLIVDEWIAILSRIRGQAAANQMDDYLDGILKRVFDIKPTTVTTYVKAKPGRPKKAAK